MNFTVLLTNQVSVIKLTQSQRMLLCCVETFPLLEPCSDTKLHQIWRGVWFLVLVVSSMSKDGMNQRRNRWYILLFTHTPWNFSSRIDVLECLRMQIGLKRCGFTHQPLLSLQIIQGSLPCLIRPWHTRNCFTHKS